MSAKLIEVPKRERWEPVPQVVEVCHKLLEAAKSGSLRAVAIAKVDVYEGEEDGIAGCDIALANRCRFALSHSLRLLDEYWADMCRKAREE